MTISYPLNLPSGAKERQVTITAENNIGISESPFNFKKNIQDWNAEQWKLSVSLPVKKREDAQEWVCFLLKLRGQYGTFYYGPEVEQSPLGVATGSPQVEGGGQTGRELETSGWTPSITGILKAGDWIQINTNIYKVLQDVDSDGSGLATLDIFPKLREAYTDGTTIVTAAPKGLWRLTSNAQEVINIDVTKTYAINFEAVEVLP